jgi:hypothetical protein
LSSVWSFSYLLGVAPTTAAPRQRGLGPRPHTLFKYQLRRVVPTNTPHSPTPDNACLISIFVHIVLMVDVLASHWNVSIVATVCVGSE